MDMKTVQVRIRRATPAAIAGVIAALFALTVMGVFTPISDYPPTRDAYFYLSLFKNAVGFFCVLFSLYAYYGPAAYHLGLAARLMPSAEIHPAIVALYFVIGVFFMGTGIRTYTSQIEAILLVQVLVFAGFFGVATAAGVYSYELARSRDDGD